MIDLNDVRSFVKIVDLGSFAAAAREIGVPKSTLSRRIAALEATLGTTLIVRDRRQFHVTDDGAAFHRRCQLFVEEARRIEDHAVSRPPDPAAGAPARSLAASSVPAGTTPRVNGISVPDRAVRRQDMVQLHILQSIRQKLYKPGDKLPAERSLAAELAVSRQAVREALRSLETTGVLRLELGAHGGAFVRDIGPDGLSYTIRNLLIVGSLPLTDLLELRASIFGQAARLAAERGNERDFRLMAENIRELHRITRDHGQVAGIPASTEFYRLAARASRNFLLAAVVDAISDIVEEMLEQIVSWPYAEEGECARLDALKAIEAGRGAEAETIIRTHCEETNRVLYDFQRAAAEAGVPGPQGVRDTTGQPQPDR